MNKASVAYYQFLEYRLFYLQNEEIEEVELAAFDLQHQTLFCSNGASNQYVQVRSITSNHRICCSSLTSKITTHSIRLIGNHGQDLLTEWKSESNEITVASANTTQCVCACGNQLFYFEIGPNSLKQIR